jgi:phage baseplate assembly protein W
MSIKLNVQRQLTPIDTSIKKGYLYKDIGFDLVLRYTDNPELYKDSEIGDLKPIYDAKAIINSIKNILTTSPGEKLLNPTFGLDLRNHLFDTVSETRAFFLGTDLYDGLTTQEPRISIDRLDVIAVIDEQEYDITLSLSVPSLNIQGLSLRGVLNNDGYTFV